jgi:hypothetical protein
MFNFSSDKLLWHSNKMGVAGHVGQSETIIVFKSLNMQRLVGISLWDGI